MSSGTHQRPPPRSSCGVFGERLRSASASTASTKPSTASITVRARVDARATSVIGSSPRSPPRGWRGRRSRPRPPPRGSCSRRLPVRASRAPPRRAHACLSAQERLAGRSPDRETLPELKVPAPRAVDQILGRPAAGADLVEKPLDVGEAPEPELEIQRARDRPGIAASDPPACASRQEPRELGPVAPGRKLDGSLDRLGERVDDRGPPKPQIDRRRGAVQRRWVARTNEIDQGLRVTASIRSGPAFRSSMSSRSSRIGCARGRPTIASPALATASAAVLGSFRSSRIDGRIGLDVEELPSDRPVGAPAVQGARSRARRACCRGSRRPRTRSCS